MSRANNRLESDISNMSNVVEGSSSGDYDKIRLPDTDDLPREKWGPAERRAEILQLIHDAGHPRELNQTELGEQYGVSQQQISKDFQKIGQHIRESLDNDRRALAVNTTVQRSIRGLLDNGEFYKAGKLALEWDDWVVNSGIQTQGTSDSKQNISEILSQ